VLGSYRYRYAGVKPFTVYGADPVDVPLSESQDGRPPANGYADNASGFRETAVHAGIRENFPKIRKGLDREISIYY
jgi:hypothetical protein